MEHQVEVVVGRRSWEHGGKNLIEKIRFRGERLGHYTSDVELADSRMTKRETYLTLYRCVDGYRVARSVLEFRRRRERARWSKKEGFTELLPVADGPAGDANGLGREYGVYDEDEARRMYPELFSVVGMPNVRHVD